MRPSALQSKLNYRASESEQEVFKMCDHIVQTVSEGVVDNIGQVTSRRLSDSSTD